MAHGGGPGPREQLRRQGVEAAFPGGVETQVGEERPREVGDGAGAARRAEADPVLVAGGRDAGSAGGQLDLAGAVPLDSCLLRSSQVLLNDKPLPAKSWRAVFL
jgi:hypothetical protein